MEEKITLDLLTQDSVSIKKQNVTTINGVEYELGEPNRKAYVNSIEGREEVKAELEEKYITAIFSVWGDSPTIKEEVTA
jgi:hypothetical protein